MTLVVAVLRLPFQKLLLCNDLGDGKFFELKLFDIAWQTKELC